MLSRHFLRSKVLQALYAAQADNLDIVVAEKNYKHHIARLNDLGTLQVASLVHFLEVANIMVDEAKHKFLPTEEELNPNTRFLDNVFLQRLADNYDLRRHCEEANINWQGVEYDDIFRQAYLGFCQLKEYKEYMNAEAGFDIDQQFALKLLKYLMNFEPLREHVCPQSLLWEDDFDQIAQYNFMMLKALDDTLDEATAIPLVHDTRNEKDVTDYEFSRQLLLVTMRHRAETEEMIRKHLKGWDFERVANMDILLLDMAVAELTEFASIPERVTVDEYIELSKEFSSDRSRLFINGILDKFVIELRASGRINKSGRGLYDPEMLTDDPEETL